MSPGEAEYERLQQRLQELQQAVGCGRMRYTVRRMLLLVVVLAITWALIFFLLRWCFGSRFDHIFVFGPTSSLGLAWVLASAAWPQMQMQIQQLQDKLGQSR